MATKKTGKGPTTSKAKTIALPPVTSISHGQSFATSKAVDGDEAMALIAKGWILTQNDDQLIVVACPHDIYEEGQ